MSTKISFSECVKYLDEKEVENYYFANRSLKNYKSSDISKRVFQRLHEGQTTKGALRWKYWIIPAAAVASLLLIVLPVSAGLYHYWQRQSSFVTGEETSYTGFPVMIYDVNTGEMFDADHNLLMYYDRTTKEVKNPDGSVREDVIVQENEDGTFICIPKEEWMAEPVWFSTTSNQQDVYTLEEVMLANGELCTISRPDQTGWKLKAGETLQYSFEKVPLSEEELAQMPDTFHGQLLEIGVICSGIPQSEVYIEEESGTFEFTAVEDGEYYIYVRSLSSELIHLRESMIRQIR